MPGSRMPDHEVHDDGDTTLFLLHGAYGSKEYFRDATAALVGAGLVISATVSSFSQKSEADKRAFLAERIDPPKAGRSFHDTARAVVDSMFAPTSAGPRVDLVKRVALGMREETFIAARSSRTRAAPAE